MPRIRWMCRACQALLECEMRRRVFSCHCGASRFSDLDLEADDPLPAAVRELAPDEPYPFARKAAQ